MAEGLPRRILCPVDFSEVSEAALRFAGRLAECAKAEIVALNAHYFEAPAYFTESRIAELTREFHETRHEAELAVAQFAQRILPGVAVRVVVEEGAPEEAIARAARDEGADVVVMGTHGRSGVSRLMLGSVAERVLRSSTIPVLTVRPTTGDEATRPRSVVCAVNDSEGAREALRQAANLANCFDAPLTVVHVEEKAGEGGIRDLCAWLGGTELPKCTVTEVARQGHAAEEILRLASEMKPDLLVIGGRHRRFWDSSALGSTTAWVARHAPCPVLTVVNEGRHHVV